MPQLSWGLALHKVTSNGVHSERAGTGLFKRGSAEEAKKEGGVGVLSPGRRRSRDTALSLSDLSRAWDLRREGQLLRLAKGNKLA